MTRDAEAEFRDLYVIFRAGYNKLSSHALEASRCRWGARPKFHYFEHLVLDISPYNGRYMHNFAGEDFVRRVKAMAIGSHPGFLSRHVIGKYSLQCCLAWRRLV